MRTLLVMLCLLAGSLAQAQEVEVKKGDVKLDGVTCMSYNDSPGVTVFHDLDGKPVIYLRLMNNAKNGKLYNQITFAEWDLTMTAQSFTFAKKGLIRKLAEISAFTDCTLSREKVDEFIMMYHEEVVIK